MQNGLNGEQEKLMGRVKMETPQDNFGRGKPKYIGQPIRIKDEEKLRHYNSLNNPKREKSADFYDKSCRKKPEQTVPRYIRNAQVNALERMVALTGFDQITEIGCGAGIFLEDLQKAAKYNQALASVVEKYFGFDFSQEAIAQARRKNPRFKDHFSVGDCYDPNFYRDGEIFCAFEVLEHIDDESVIKNIPRGAYLIATVPNFGDPGHVRVYDTNIIIARWGKYFHIKHIQELETGTPNISWYIFVGVRK